MATESRRARLKPQESASRRSSTMWAVTPPFRRAATQPGESVADVVRQSQAATHSEAPWLKAARLKGGGIRPGKWN